MDEHPIPPDIDPEPAESAYTPPPSQLPKIFKQIQPRYIAPLIALALFLPALVVSVLNRQSIFSWAKKPLCTPISYVRVHPGEVITYLANEPTQMSALAYDSDNQIVQTKVVYRWGISSTNSIGDLDPDQEIALFTPQREGSGDIWVRVKNSCTTEWITTSVPVTVSAVAPTPTPTPTPRPTTIPTPSLSPSPTFIPTPTPSQSKTIFISSIYYDGNLGGLGGADSKCQALATTASLPGLFRAWLSSDTVSAASRLTHSSVPYRRVDGAIVATNWSDLTDGSLQNPINISEQGTVINSSWVWTNSFADGSIRQSSDSSCLNWLSTSSGGATGDSTRTDSGWSEYGASACYYRRPLYCIEQ